MQYKITDITNEYRSFVVKYIAENWGSPMIITRGRVHHAEELPGFISLVNGQIKGIITYQIHGNDCEIVSLDSMVENIGIGSSLIDQVISLAKHNGLKRVWLITTNDNTHAFRFYQRRGFELVTVYRNAICESRKLKPEIPFKGFDDIPILHEIEFEKVI